MIPAFISYITPNKNFYKIKHFIPDPNTTYHPKCVIIYFFLSSYVIWGTSWDLSFMCLEQVFPKMLTQGCHSETHRITECEIVHSFEEWSMLQ